MIQSDTHLQVLYTLYTLYTQYTLYTLYTKVHDPDSLLQHSLGRGLTLKFRLRGSHTGNVCPFTLHCTVVNQVDIIWFWYTQIIVHLTPPSLPLCTIHLDWNVTVWPGGCQGDEQARHDGIEHSRIFTSRWNILEHSRSTSPTCPVRPWWMPSRSPPPRSCSPTAMQKLSMITTGTFRTGTYSVYTVYSMYSAGQGPQEDQGDRRSRHGQLLLLLPHPWLRAQEGHSPGRRCSHQSHQVYNNILQNIFLIIFSKIKKKIFCW